MSKVSEVKVGSSKANLGMFRAKLLNMTSADDIGEYERLRTGNNNAASGIKIERIQNVTKKTVVTECSTDGDKVTTSSEDLCVFIEWWEKPISSDKGASDEKVPDAARDWSEERPAQQ